jgi:hypothetical protein
MDEILIDDDVGVVDPKKVLKSAYELDYDQIAVIGMKDGKFEVFSSHPAEQMENMIDDALDALYVGELGFDGE